MKLVAKLSRSAAFAFGALAIVAVSPSAQAKDKPKPEAEAKGYPFKLGPKFRAAASPVQAALAAKNAADAQAKIAAAEALAAAPDEKYIVGTFRNELGALLNDRKMQSDALNAMIASGSGAAAADVINFKLGLFAAEAGDHAKALTHFNEADRLGLKRSDLYISMSESNFKLKNVPASLTALDRAIAFETTAGRKAPQDWYRVGRARAYNAKLSQETSKWSRLLIRNYPSPDAWRDGLVVYRDSTKLDGQPLLDLYRLMRDTKSIKGEKDFYEYAATAVERGLAGEGKSVIDEGFATGGIPKASRPLNELLTTISSKVAADRASLATSERQATGAATGKLAAGTADAYLGYGDNAKASTLYKLALQKGQVDVDAVTTRLAIALTRSGQTAEARKLFSQVTGVRSEIAQFWTLWLDTRAPGT